MRRDYDFACWAYFIIFKGRGKPHCEAMLCCANKTKAAGTNKHFFIILLLLFKLSFSSSSSSSPHGILEIVINHDKLAQDGTGINMLVTITLIKSMSDPENAAQLLPIIFRTVPSKGTRDFSIVWSYLVA